MDERLSDRHWRSASRACCFYSLIPIFGFFGFLFMGRRSGRKQFTTLGAVYGLISLLALTAFVLAEFIDRLSSRMTIIYQIEDYMSMYGTLGMVLIWPVCLIHTFALSNQYLQYLALKQIQTPKRSPLTAQESWRSRNLLWQHWAWFPYIGGFSLIFAGSRMKKPGYTAFGILALALTWGTSVAESVVYRVGSFSTANALGTLSASFMLAFWLAVGLTVALIREDYLDIRASQWTADTSRHNVLLDAKWRSANSRWQIWTYLPWLGGVGILVAGIRNRKGKTVALGILLCLLIFGVALTNIIANNMYYRSDILFTPAAKPYQAVQDAMWVLQFLAHALIFYCGCHIRWDMLVARAASLQGYSSEFERELDLHNRSAARKASAPKVTPAAVPDPTPAPRSVVTPPVEQSLLDINHCTLEELMTLPGIGIAQAKHAMQHRSEQGGFRSADEFVDILEIKPHFAAQLFRMITVSAPATPVIHADAGGSRRRIDF